MASSSAWPNVFSIQARLTTVGTPRAIVIAAHAAINSGHPKETLRILDDFTQCFRHGQHRRASLISRPWRTMPSATRSVLSRASSSWLHRLTAQELASVWYRHTSASVIPDPARHHAEQFIFGEAADPNEAVALADVWKGTDPEFSRRLVTHAVLDPRLPMQATPHAFALAVQLGLKDVEARLAPIVFDVEKNGAKTGVVVIESVEALMAQMKERAENIRKCWQYGLRGNNAVISPGRATHAHLLCCTLESLKIAGEFHRPASADAAEQCRR